MLTDRQELILKVIVQEFIKTVQPVGSKTILDLLHIKISSATIRNESAFLEEKGYLEKQHTSSGRVPSTQGYRYYVDFLMNKTSNEELKHQLEKLINLRNNNIEDVLDQATNIISEMTKLTAIISTKETKNDVLLKKIDLIPLSDENASVIFVLSNGMVQKKVFNLRNISLSDLSISIELFSDNLVNEKISDIDKITQKLKSELKISVQNYEFIFQSFLGAILQGGQETKEMHGLKYMLENPEFNNTEKLKSVIQIMEKMSPFDWYNVHYGSNQSIHKIVTSIGEDGDNNLDDIAMLGAEFEMNGKSTAITLVGPKRMNYDQAMQLVEWLIQLVDKKQKEKYE
ncbi:heat-inducible transcription repressor HrcA [Williamsoniiplasma luminosum]|uniref:Heat-inducible transcription repressor HrcA n=1 Tax=Williamsoniiplasma luminosum TaxID=214888 RepID=A0A2K8NUF9_9MOLU|nr:heat-inducible transcriptional repressor HrcA [Williamsoniiplasma luminosum]ATZ17404.1 heat-inducible transcription repressor HrcA [Williamsoniiplasma luminosum]AVP49212.1 MAG: heat-inducible transcription repressor HrcA [Williamsoniiplasma luminosum]